MKELRKKLLSLLHSKKGFTLVEIMISLGVMGIVGLGIVNLTDVAGDQNKAYRQNSSIENAMGRINKVLSRADTCNNFAPNVTTAEVQAIAAPALEADVSVVNVVQTMVPAVPAPLDGESITAKVQLVITFEKGGTGVANKRLNRIAYLRYIYENPNGADPTVFTGCGNYESDNARAAFEANCRSIGGTIRISNVNVNPWDGTPGGTSRYWCDISTIDASKYFVENIRKEVCERLLGEVGSYNNAAAARRCRDLMVTGSMTAENIDPTRIALDDGGYNFRTTFNQNQCAALGDNNFITGINIDGTVVCGSVDWCVQGTAGCGAFNMDSGLDHCTTDCSCAFVTQADTSENDFGDADGDGGVNTCRPTLSGECAANRTEEGGGQYDEGAGTDYLTYTCYGLDCDFKDYFQETSGTVASDNEYDSVLSIGLFSTPDLTNANQVTTCGTPTLESSVTAGLCAKFDSTSLANFGNYPIGNNTVPDSNGLNISLVSGKTYGTNKDSCNGSVGVCRNGGSGASGTGVAATEGVCCSKSFDDQPGSGDQCGNPMQDSCGNTYNNELPGVQERWSVQCTSTGADGTQNFCEINGVDRGNSGFVTINPASSSGCCQENYSCGTDPGSFSSCQAAGSSFSYCTGGLTCSRESSAGRCCKSSYSCAESPDPECTGFHGAAHNTCSATEDCLGSGSTATCVDCITDAGCASTSYCSGNSCQPDICVQGVETDTAVDSCTPTAATAGCGADETVDPNSGTRPKSRTCNANGSGWGSFSYTGSCTGGTCSCTATLPAASSVSCGTTQSNCAGTVTGTQCPGGQTCSSGTCVAACADPPLPDPGDLYCGTTQSNCHGTVTGTKCLNFFQTCQSGICECFVAGTKILMADGTEKDIEDVVVGDILKGVDQDNEVLELKRRDYSGKVYSINGSKAFVTEGHPFMTIDGWKSFNPEKAMEINPTLSIKQLGVGDVLITKDGHVSVDEFRYEIKDVPVYNFEVSGERVYYADGFLVHNK